MKNVGTSPVTGSGGPSARKSVDIIQGIQAAYTQIPSNVEKVDVLKLLFGEAIRSKLSVSTGSFFKSKKDEAGVIAAFRKALVSSSNADFQRDANASLDSLCQSNSAAGGGGGGGVSKRVVEPKLSPRASIPRPPMDLVGGLGVVGGGSAATSRSAMPQEASYQHISQNVNSKSSDFKVCAEVISQGRSSIDVLRDLMEVTPKDFHEGWVQMAVAHGIPRDSLPKSDVPSDRDRVMTRLAATIDHIHSKHQPKAAPRAAGGGGGGGGASDGYGIVGGGAPVAASTSGSVMPQVKLYPYDLNKVSCNRSFMRYQAGVSIDLLRERSGELTDPSTFTVYLKVIASAHGIPGDAVLQSDVTSNRDRVMTRLAATIDQIHGKHQPKAAPRAEGGGGGGVASDGYGIGGGGVAAFPMRPEAAGGGGGDPRTIAVLKSITTLKGQMDVYLKGNPRGLDTEHLKGPDADESHGILLRQLLDTVDEVAEIGPENRLTEIVFVTTDRLREISHELGKVILSINPSSGKLNSINEEVFKHYFCGVKYVIQWGSNKPLERHPTNIVQGQDLIRIEDRAPISNTFNGASRGEWNVLLTKLSHQDRLTPQDKTTLYMTAKTMAYYFPSIPPSKESLQKFLSFFSGNPDPFTEKEHSEMDLSLEWNSKNIQNIYGMCSLSDAFFQNSDVDTLRFNLMNSDDSKLSNPGIDKRPFKDKCFMLKTASGGHDYGIMFKQDQDGIFAVVLDSSILREPEIYRDEVDKLAEKLGFANGVQIVKPLTDGGSNFLYSKGEGEAKRGVQNMCRYTPAVYSAFPFERKNKIPIPLSEEPFTAAFSREYDALYRA